MSPTRQQMISFLIAFLMFVGSLATLANAEAVNNPVVPNGKLGEFRHGTFPSLGERTHVGVDIVAPCGSDIYAFADGQVKDIINSKNDKNFNALGYMVLIEHPASLIGKPFYTLYLHMQGSPAVKIGDQVKGGNIVIGKVGDTGMASGCHTHFEIRYFPERLSKWGNIYGSGDQRTSEYFKQNWEAPVAFFEKYPKGITINNPINPSNNDVPIPEFYGTYAIINGNLLGIDVLVSTITPQNVEVPFGKRAAVGNIIDGAQPAKVDIKKVPVFPKNVKFIFYYQSSGIITPMTIAKESKLQPLFFVQNISVDTGWPNNIRRSILENAWESGDPTGFEGIFEKSDIIENIEFLLKPVPDKNDMVIALPPKNLNPGVYRLIIMDKTSFLFAVEPLKEGETLKCANISCTYMMLQSTCKSTSCSSPSLGTTFPVKKEKELPHQVDKQRIIQDRATAQLAYKSKDYVRAFQLYKSLAEQGDADSEYALGTLYLEGQGVEKNEGEAVKWIQKAALDGSADAQYHLGLMYKLQNS